MLLASATIACTAPRPPGSAPAAPIRIGVDAGHGNYHTIDDRYQPFAELLRGHGFTVTSLHGHFDAARLAPLDVLVIANATGPEEGQHALAADEVTAIRRWVDGGGALWLIADHFPFGGAVAPLAASFGVEMSNGLVGDEDHRWSGSDDAGVLVFAGDLLADHPIVRGRRAAEQVHTVVTFVGQSLRGPADSVAVLRLADSAQEMLPPDRRLTSAAGRAQGLALLAGQGRIYVAAEAAMFTEQTKGDGTPMGMNAPGNDDRQYTINVARWLSRGL
jgi:hypothetical protein